MKKALTITALLASTALAASALADGLANRPVPSRPVAESPVIKWNGIWVRGAGGFEMSNTEVTVGGATIDGVGGDGFLYEVAAGVDIDIGPAVLGLWGRYSWHDADFTAKAGPFTFNAGVDTSWAAGARLGVPLGDRRVLPYMLLGYGKAHMQWDSSVPLGLPALSDTNFWTIGGGVEYKATKNIRVGAEVRANVMDEKQWGATGITVDPMTVEGVVFVALAFGNEVKLD